MTKRDALLVGAIYAAWLGASYLINIVTSGARTPQAVFESWVRFDGIYFRAIAEYGYSEASQRIRPDINFPFLTAFFPLFSLLIRAAAPLFGHNYSAAAVVVPQTLTLLVLLALFKLVTLDFSKRTAWLTVLSLITFPTFYFMVTAYSETVFLLSVVVAFYLYRTGKLPATGVVGALASAARIMGAPFLVGAFALDAAINRWQARQRTFRPHLGGAVRPRLGGAGRQAQGAVAPREPASRLVWLCLIPLGLLSYMVYLGLTFNDPLLFMQGHASSEWKVGFDPTGPIKGLLLPLATLVKHHWSAPEFRANLFNSAFFYFAIGMTLYGWRKQPPVYSYYAALAILLPMLTGSLISMPRYLLVVFPLFLSMGTFFDAHPRGRVLLALLAVVGLFTTHLFFRTVFLG